MKAGSNRNGCCLLLQFSPTLLYQSNLFYKKYTGKITIPTKILIEPAYVGKPQYAFVLWVIVFYKA